MTLAPRIDLIENKLGQLDKNYLINGNFYYDQRFGGNLNSVQGTYSMDRWLFTNGVSCQRVPEVGQDFKFAGEIISSGATANAIKQRIESIYTHELKGKTITISVWLKLISGAFSTAPKLQIITPDVADNHGGATTLVINDFLDSDALLDGTYRLFRKTIVVTNQMADNGFDFQFGDFGLSTSTMRFANAQIKIGSSDEEFTLAGRNASEELQLCQRYFEKSYSEDVPVTTVTKDGATSLIKQDGSVTDRSYSNLEYKVDKRAIPVLSFYGPGDGIINHYVAYNGAGAHGTLSTFGAFDSKARAAVWFNHNVAISVTLLYLVHWTADAEL